MQLCLCEGVTDARWTHECWWLLQIRDEEVFKGLDNMVKNFLVSVPLVADLRSPAMRDRHWQQLMEATKVRLVKCQAMIDWSWCCPTA